MTHAFVSPSVLPAGKSGASGFQGSRCGALSPATTRFAKAPVRRAYNAFRMAAGEGDSESEAPKQSDSVDEVLNTIPDLTSSGSEGEAEGTGEDQFSLESMNDDDLADVVVLEELKPPQWVENEKAVKEARLKFRVHENDTGSPEYQIASLTKKIEYLTNHLKQHPKDYASTRGLLKMVSKRTRLLKYLRSESSERFYAIIEGLNIRISQKLRRLGDA